MEKVKSKVILELTKKLRTIFEDENPQKMTIESKSDFSLVTEVDYLVSELFKKELSSHSKYSSYSFFSEEDHKSLNFPAIILDPIDGTRELVSGIPECSLSLALMKSNEISHSENYAWIYNPFTGFTLSTDDISIRSPISKKSELLGLVSRSEYERGYFKKIQTLPENIKLAPRGSIAFKLGLLASGACDFVISLSAKNIWDIAAGTILLNQRGISLYQNNQRITHLSEVQITGVLIWAKDENQAELWSVFQK